MTRQGKLNKRPGLPHAGLVLQLLVIILLPLTLLLVAITFGSLSIHQRAMRSLVGERDERAVSIAASALSDQIKNRMQELNTLLPVFEATSSQSPQITPSMAGEIPASFDSGLAVFDGQGNLVSTSSADSLWRNWMDNASAWQVIYPALAAEHNKLLVYPSPLNDELLGLVSVSATGSNLVVGAFSIQSLANATLTNLVPPGGQLSILLVDGNNHILYKFGNLSDQSANHPGVAQALLGQTGTTYVTVGGDEHVTAFSPVSTAGWALITEESWQAVATPTLRTSQIAPLVLVPAVLIMLLALYLGATQVVKPLGLLEAKATTLASGDFRSIHEPVGGIAEIQHLQKELIRMADKVREAQHSLHGYIGVITSAQEDERRRLARELHDDTLQALIALKQRVQLAQLELQPVSGTSAPQSPELDEIAQLTEQTIVNLRRLTRDLRPVYLEDLGLAPALEVLARETGQSMGITVEFIRQGTERRLDPSVELALYRMAQEACSNISRHAHAKHASLLINYATNFVALQVEDNGIGFEVLQNPSEYAASGHYGLLGLHERAELIGASMDIRTSPGGGTRLTVTVPA